MQIKIHRDPTDNAVIIHRHYGIIWRHNEYDGDSNHRRLDYLLNRLLRRRSKKTSKLRFTGLCAGNSPVTGGFPSQRASNAEMFSFGDVIMGITWHFLHNWSCLLPPVEIVLHEGTVLRSFDNFVLLAWKTWLTSSPFVGVLRRFNAQVIVMKCISWWRFIHHVQMTSWTSHDDVIKWKHFPRYWPFVRGIHRSPVNSPHKGQWRGALMFSLISTRLNGWVNNDEAGDLRWYRAHYDVTVMLDKIIRSRDVSAGKMYWFNNQYWFITTNNRPYYT